MNPHQAAPVLKLVIIYTQNTVSLQKKKIDSFITALTKLIPNGSAIHTEGNP